MCTLFLEKDLAEYISPIHFLSLTILKSQHYVLLTFISIFFLFLSSNSSSKVLKGKHITIVRLFYILDLIYSLSVLSQQNWYLLDL